MGFWQIFFPRVNGVKQGAISSPVLFCVFIDELLNRLKSAKLGCFIGNIYAGSMAYADDLTLLAPTADAMRRMLQICSEYANEFSVSFNANKSKCMQFLPRKLWPDNVRPVFFYISGNVIEFVDRWPHLGNILDVGQSDSGCTLNLRSQMIGQINDVLFFR